jgi:hypothetical protein
MAQGINVLDYATLTVSSSAVTLVDDASPTLPGKCKRAFITCEDDSVRWRADGTDPTSTEGHEVTDGGYIELTGANYRQLLENITFIRVTSDAKLKITYFD